jgi:hypothetical protein
MFDHDIFSNYSLATVMLCCGFALHSVHETSNCRLQLQYNSSRIFQQFKEIFCKKKKKPTLIMNKFPHFKVPQFQTFFAFKTKNSVPTLFGAWLRVAFTTSELWLCKWHHDYVQPKWAHVRSDCTLSQQGIMDSQDLAMCVLTKHCYCTFINCECTLF